MKNPRFTPSLSFIWQDFGSQPCGSSWKCRVGPRASLSGPLRYCSLPRSWIALNIVPNLLPTLGRRFEPKEYGNGCFRLPLVPPPAAGFLSHIYPLTPFILLPPRPKLVPDLLPWISAGSTTSNQMSDFFTPLARISHLPCKLPAFPLR